MDQTRRAMRKLLNEQAPPPEEDDVYERPERGVREPEDIDRMPDPPTEDPVGVSGYPDAGEQAPAPVKKVIRDWSRLPSDVQEREPLLYYLLGGGTDAFKMDPEIAEYTDESQKSDQQCANCEFSYQKVSNGRYLCSQIRGWIQPPGWCKLWKPAQGGGEGE